MHLAMSEVWMIELQFGTTRATGIALQPVDLGFKFV